MSDFAYIGATVIFFIVVAAIASGADRLGRRDGNDRDPLMPIGTDPAAEHIRAESRVTRDR